MHLNRNTTMFSLTLIALLATVTVPSFTPEKPREVSEESVSTYTVNPHAVARMHARQHDTPEFERASFYAMKKIDPDFHYDLDSPSSEEFSGQALATYPAELIYEWPEDKASAETQTSSSSNPADSGNNSSDAMVRPEYRGKIIAVSENITPIAPDNLRQSVVDIALKYQGTPYVWGGNTPNGWDCSGFVKYVYGKAGVGTARTTSSIRASNQFKRTTSPQPGDLVFQNNGGHVGIYLGNGKMIGAQNPSVGTIVHNVSRNPLYGYYTLR